MLPSVLASQLKRGVKDFLRTTFPINTPHFEGMLESFLERDQLFKGPYLSAQLPFRTSTRADEFFPAVPLGFAPYHHQEQAFERLQPGRQASTLIATGTGSGKTEGFLWPILEYCRQHQGERGIKAILIYPMNALANDQSKRIARVIHANEALKGIRAGLFIGRGQGGDYDALRAMGPDHIVTDREAIKDVPPDLLLTNYKMLDYLMVRPEHQRLWKGTSADTLRYLVVDELHTFDGAQGTDLACLIRRLKKRLGVSQHQLCCVGTSATMGADQNEEKLRNYAAQVFAEPFEEGSVVGEERIDIREFIGGELTRFFKFPAPDELTQVTNLHAEAVPALVRAHYGLWFEEAPEVSAVEEEEWRLALGKQLKQHLFVQNLLKVLGGKPRALADVAEELGRLMPRDFGERPATFQEQALGSIVVLLSWARGATEAMDGRQLLTPFLNVRLQVWLREMRRMVASVSTETPLLSHHDDLNEAQRQTHLPVVHCRTCGATGWAGIKPPDRQVVKTDLQTFYKGFFGSPPSPDLRFIFPVSANAEAPLLHGQEFQLDTHTLELEGKASPKSSNGVPGKNSLQSVFVSKPDPGGKGLPKRRRCPYCGSVDSLTIMGSQAASLTSVMISQVFAAKHNEDKKLLAFSDSVQDAAHRAGFFEARTFRFNVRGAMQQFLERAGDGVSLKEFPSAFARYWRGQWGDEKFIATFIAPDMQWLLDADTPPKGITMTELIERRITWEVLGEYGYRSSIGRTLEKSGASAAVLQEGSLERVLTELLPVLRNEIGGLRELSLPELQQFVLGVLLHLRQKGAVYEPLLQPYVENGGNPFALSKAGINNLCLPRLGGRSRLPSFLAKRGNKQLDPLLTGGSKNTYTWMERWAIKSFDPEHTPMLASQLDVLYHRVLSALDRHEVVFTREIQKNNKVWGLRAEALQVTTDVARCRCRQCGHLVAIGSASGSVWEGACCLRYQCEGRYERVAPDFDYYRALYRDGDLHRIVAREHTGLLDRKEREMLEDRFAGGNSPGAPNVLSATPTLEMGVNIGQLSTVVLCSVPPEPSNFVQRVGRAGRKDGNAVDVTIATSDPHDLYFFADPEEMIAGAVDPPGVFLDAVQVLYRQFVAFCFDEWMQVSGGPPKIPDSINPLLASRKHGFPQTLYDFMAEQRERLLKGFLLLFSDDLREATREGLTAMVRGDDGAETFAYRMANALARRRKKRDDLQRRTERLRVQKDELKERPLAKKQKEEEEQQINRELRALAKIKMQIGRQDTFNFLTNEGLLPNYAFPEAGVELQSVLYSFYQKDGRQGKIWAEEFARSGPAAIRELAPGSVFYANGRKVRIDEVQLAQYDASSATFEQWHFCDACDFMAQTVKISEDQVCPRCGSTQFKDRGQERTLVRMQAMAATSNDRDSRIQDESDTREPSNFDTKTFVKVYHDTIAAAYRIDSEELPFGYDFIRRVNLREVNFGPPSVQPDGFLAGGNEVKGEGFLVCPDCGRTNAPHENSRSKRTDIKHTRSCRLRSSKNKKDQDPSEVYFYRELESEAVRILLPATTFAGSPERVQSLRAAFHLGLEAHFQGSVDHLRSEIIEAPVDGSTIRKQFLLLYDTVPGGTGYLAELTEHPEALLDVLTKALAHCKTCTCRTTGLDGCYRCLLAYRRRRDMAHVSRTTAVEVLSKILEHRDSLTRIETLNEVSVNALIGSELEARFVEALRSTSGYDTQVEKTVVRGHPGYRLTIAGEVYEIQPQVELGSAEGLQANVSIDFVLWPRRSEVRPIALFLDGWQYHHYRIGRDMAQRAMLRRAGQFHVWSLTWQDVVRKEDNLPSDTANVLQPMRRGSAVMQVINSIFVGENYDDKAFGEIFSEDSFHWLLRYLAAPVEDAWTAMAFAQALMVAHGSDGREALSAAEDVLAKNLVMNLQGAADDDLQLMGYKSFDSEDGQIYLWVAITRDAWETVTSSHGKEASGVQSVAHLDDAADVRGRQAFKGRWEGMLRFYNLLQFLPQTVVVTSGGSENPAIMEVLQQEPLLGSTIGHANEALLEARWDEIREYATEPVQLLLNELEAREAPLPRAPYELMSESEGVIAEAALGWVEPPLVVLREGQQLGAVKFKAEAYTVLQLSGEANIQLLADKIANLLSVETTSATPEQGDS